MSVPYHWKHLNVSFAITTALGRVIQYASIKAFQYLSECTSIYIAEGYDIMNMVSKLTVCGKYGRQLNHIVNSFVSTVIITSGDVNITYQTPTMKNSRVSGDGFIDFNSTFGNIYEQYLVSNNQNTTNMTLHINTLGGYNHKCMYGGIHIRHEVSYAKYRSRQWMPVEAFDKVEIPEEAERGKLRKEVGHWCGNPMESSLTAKLNFLLLEQGDNYITVHSDFKYFNLTLRLRFQQTKCAIVANNVSSYCVGYGSIVYSPGLKMYCHLNYIYPKPDKCIVFHNHVRTSFPIIIFSQRHTLFIQIQVRKIFIQKVHNDKLYYIECIPHFMIRLFHQNGSKEDIRYIGYELYNTFRRNITTLGYDMSKSLCGILQSSYTVFILTPASTSENLPSWHISDQNSSRVTSIGMKMFPSAAFFSVATKRTLYVLQIGIFSEVQTMSIFIQKIYEICKYRISPALVYFMRLGPHDAMSNALIDEDSVVILSAATISFIKIHPTGVTCIPTLYIRYSANHVIDSDTILQPMKLETIQVCQY